MWAGRFGGKSKLPSAPGRFGWPGLTLFIFPIGCSILLKENWRSDRRKLALVRH